MKKLLLIVIACAVALGLYAQNSFSERQTHVAASQALEVGYSFMRTNSHERGNVSKQTMRLVYTGTSTDGTECYYVFSLRPTGFVIVSADERAEPILGYSYDNPFMVEGMPDNVRNWLDHYGKQIETAVDNGILPSTEITEKWAALKSGQALSVRSVTAVSPLIQTSWDQDQYYNQMCPADASGPGGHAYAGCVATAMAQIIRYWQWPSQGFNSHSYVHNNYGTLSVDYNTASYNYSNMPNSLSSSSSSTQKTAVAKLIYHCGVAVDMDYAANGSGAYTFAVPNALYNYFAYANNGTYVYRPDYSTTEWTNMIIQELNNSRPVLYAGAGSGGGHAFVCDGYDNNGNFHFNWGWSGSYNSGYYSLDALTPGSHNYSQDQEAIIGISATGTFMRCSVSDMLFAAPIGEVSDVQTLSVRGHSLSGSINVTAGSGFTISVDGTNFYTSVSLPSTGGSLYVKYTPTSSNNVEYTMTLTSGTCSANVTLHGSVSTEVCLAPKNLSGTHTGTAVNLSWNEPVTYSSGSPASAVLSWETGSDVTSYYGYNFPAVCMVHRFVPSDFASYNHYLLRAVSFIGSPYATSYSIVVFKGGSYTNGNFNPGEQLVNQLVPMSTVNTYGWNTVTLLNPVLLESTSELWFGVVATGDYIIPYVTGNVVSNKGNVLGFKYDEGDTGFNWYGGYEYNIPLKGTVEKISGQVSRYDVYRQSMLIGNSTSTTYTDSNPLATDCQYTITAVWSSGCMEGSAVTVAAPEIAKPTVTTNNVSNISATTATCGGRVTSAGGARVTARGVCWSTSQNPTVNDSYTTNGSGTGGFTSAITGLTPSTTYYVRAYATNLGGTSYGAQKTFTTTCAPPTISISGNTTINYGQSTTLTASGAASYVWSNGSTSSSITVSPTSSTTYSVTGTNQQGCPGTADVTVTVNSIAPTVTTKSVSGITKTSATCGGNVSSAGGANVTARGVCWSTSHNPTVAGSHTSNGSGTGSFTSNLTDLTPNTTYYVRAYAMNSAGTAYGSEKSFKTDNCSAIVPYSESFDDYTASTTAETGVQPTCWDVVAEYVTLTEATKPQIFYTSSYATSGSYSLRMKNRCVYAMPELDANVNVRDLTMTFNLRQPKAVYRLQIGVLDGQGNFELVKTIHNASTGMEGVTVDFASYTGSGHRIAFRNTLVSGSTLDYSINYLDDITLDYTMSCGISEIPFAEYFDNYTTSTTSETGVQPDCWEVIVEDVALTNTTKPQVYCGYATSGSYTLRLKNRCVYAMPELDESISVQDLTMTMKLRQPKSVYRLQVGVVDDQDNFKLVKTINNASTNTEDVTVDFANYTGSGRRIAFRNTLVKGSTLDYSINYIDNIVLDYSSSCGIAVLPYAENFDNYTTSTTAETGIQPDCWEVVTEDVALTNSTMPQVYHGYATSGSYSLRMKNRCVFAMPRLVANIPVNGLTMTFKLRQPKSLYRLQVGVVDNQGNFELVKTINNASTGTEDVSVSFANYTGNGHRIAFRNTLVKGSTLDYSINYIDNINLTGSANTKSEEVTDGDVMAPDMMSADRYLESIMVYPNPTTGELHIDAVDVRKVECYSQMGQLVRVYENVRDFDLGDLAQGVYVLRITVPQGVTMRKVVKRR